MIQFRFAAAFAVSYNLDWSPADGILGLGLSKYVAVVAAWIVWCAVTTMSSPVNSDTRTPIFRPGLRHLLTLLIPPDLLRLVILLTILSYAPFTS